MAAKGYVVLFTNPRGSTSYGQDFGNIIQYHYPGDDYKDLMAGVDEVLKKGYVDANRLGVTGGSGGGLLTNWTITQTQRFKAAVSQRDIADWYGFWFTADFTLFQPTWFRKAPWEDPQDFAARSPITHVANVTTPLMLVNGDADYRTPPSDGGEMMFRALKYRKIPTVMVRFPRETHELSRSGEPWHRVERLQHIVGWMDQWLMGKKKAAYAPRIRNLEFGIRNACEFEIPNSQFQIPTRRSQQRLTASRSAWADTGFRGRRFGQAEQIRQQLIRAVGPRRQLPPQAEAEVEPASLADPRFDQRAELLAGVVLERVVHRHQIHVLRILLAEEVQPALLHPVGPRRRADLVREVEHRVIRHQHLHRHALVATRGCR